jgi:hypothetical protein
MLPIREADAYHRMQLSVSRDSPTTAQDPGQTRSRCACWYGPCSCGIWHTLIHVPSDQVTAIWCLSCTHQIFISHAGTFPRCFARRSFLNRHSLVYRYLISNFLGIEHLNHILWTAVVSFFPSCYDLATHTHAQMEVTVTVKHFYHVLSNRLLKASASGYHGDACTWVSATTCCVRITFSTVHQLLRYAYLSECVHCMSHAPGILF